MSQVSAVTKRVTHNGKLLVVLEFYGDRDNARHAEILREVVESILLPMPDYDHRNDYASKEIPSVGKSR